ncbi:MAG: T9SS type A sorting domain-containing protein [Flavobacteriales bacterium]|nr:T9SS type A sorting domain-containing protein [Flavobacteriales bacterium]
MKNLIAVFFLLFSSFYHQAHTAVQTYTFSQICDAHLWLITNNQFTECNFESIEFMGETFDLVLVNKSVQTDQNDIITSGERYLFLGDPTEEVSFFPDMEGGDVVNGSLDFGPLTNIWYEQYQVGEEWPSDPVSTSYLTTNFIGLEFQVGNNVHYGWLSYNYDQGGSGQIFEIVELAIENIPNFPIQVNSQVSTFNGEYDISGRSFIDQNSDGVYDPGEPTIATCSFDISNSAINFIDYNTTSPYILNLDENTYDLSINYDPTIWVPTTSTTANITLNSGNPSVPDLNFGFIPNGIVASLNGNISPQSARCNEIRTHTISVQNTGNVESNGYLAYEIDDLCSFPGTNGIDSIVGNTAFFSWTDLGFGSIQNFYLDLQMPSTAFIGEELDFSLDLYNSSGVYLGGNDIYLEVSCAYDPNDKTEFNGYTDNGFILPGDELEYLIRFQNTGNDTAYNVFLIDDLSPLLDWDSFEAQSASHPYESFILEDGRLYVGFDDIFLPDSTTNEPESNGFFKFTINCLDGLPPWTLIENNTEIYFDFNPPILTNTTINTVFECEGLSEFSIEETYCSGEEMIAYSEQEYIENYSWKIDGFEFSTDSILDSVFLPTGNYWVSLTTVNPLCTASDSLPINVVDPPLADAGTDTSYCSLFGNLFAELSGGSGEWTGPSQVSFSSTTDANASIIASAIGDYVLHWTVNNGVCSATDSVAITFYEEPWVEIQQIGLDLLANTFASGPFQWYLNGVLIDGATEEIYTPVETGNYSVTVVGLGNCLGQSNELFFSQIGLDSLSDPSFSISPNPFEYHTVIQFQNLNGNKMNLELLDEQGRIIREYDIINNEILIEREGLSSGIYFLKLKTSDSKILLGKKLIIE